MDKPVKWVCAYTVAIDDSSVNDSTAWMVGMLIQHMKAQQNSKSADSPIRFPIPGDFENLEEINGIPCTLVNRNDGAGWVNIEMSIEDFVCFMNTNGIRVEFTKVRCPVW